MNHFGFHYLIDGFKLIFKPGIKRFVIIPLIINVLLFIGLFLLARHYFAEFNHWIISFLPHGLLWLGKLLWLLFFVVFFLVFTYTFVSLANLLAAPFNSLLAEKVELYLTGELLEEKSFWEIVKDTPRALGRQFAIMGYYLPRAFVLLLFFFIPIVHIFAALLWFLFNAWFMTLQFLDYPTDNHQIPLSHVHAWLWNNRLLSLSFGTSVLLVTMIPVVNFFVVPAAVAGATKLWVTSEPGDQRL